jgi:type IV fimbrial biogenesis protein FimT
MVSLRRQGGFTLAELMVAVGILAILTAVATPSMRDIIDVQRARSGSSDLFTSLMRARSEAVKRNAEVTVTPTDSGNWALGWRMPNPSASSQNIEAHGAIPSISITGPGSVVYQANGRLKGTTEPHFEISTARNEKRCLLIDLTGRPYTKKSSC